MSLLYNRMNNPLDVFYSQLALEYAEGAKATYQQTEAHVCLCNVYNVFVLFGNFICYVDSISVFFCFT